MVTSGASLAAAHATEPRASELVRSLDRLDALLSRAVAATQESSGRDPGSDPFRGLYLAHDDVARSLTRERGSPFGVAPDADPELDAPLARLAAQFGLSLFDVDLLVIALAPEIDLRYERIYAYLQDDVTRRHPSVDLALSLLCSSAAEKLARRAHLASYAPLVRFSLIELAAEDQPSRPFLARALAVDEQLARALLGIGGVDRRCAAFTTVSWPDRSFDDLGVSPGLRAVLDHAAARALSGEPLRLAVDGPESGGQRATAEAIASAAASALVAVDVSALRTSGDLGAALRLVLRERWLRGAVLLLDGVDVLDGREGISLAEALASEAGVVVLASREPWYPPVAETRAPLGLVRATLELPDADARRAHWEAAGVVDVPAGDLDALAERFVLTRAQISEAAASAFALGGSPQRGDLFAVARAQSSQELGALAARIPPRASWQDLVVPDDVRDQLCELTSWVAHRRRVLGDWGFGPRLSRGRGATALFAGASGTGKTLAAEVVAGELGLDLFRIDLSGVVSKYIGETEKNLDRIFRAAEDANAMLFFDEADALFGKRSEVRDSHDRYANIEISYLLQKMESYDGRGDPRHEPPSEPRRGLRPATCVHRHLPVPRGGRAAPDLDGHLAGRDADRRRRRPGRAGRRSPAHRRPDQERRARSGLRGSGRWRGGRREARCACAAA